ncbi:GGDEF domain-containing protein [Marinomonas agarivorans]|nr:GGDEF domain-containing protein [Marinomonas agarivorans]
MKLKRVTFTLSKKIILLLQGIIILASISLPLFQFFYINPAFENLLVQNSEDEAVRVAHRLERFVIEGFDNRQSDLEHETLAAHFQLTPEIENYLNTAILDFNLWKIKLFNQDGTVIYSSEQQDIGSTNKKPYFQNQIAKGIPYTKTGYKTTNRDENTRRYVVETYVPIMLTHGEFIGAFELYYDITDRENKLLFLTSEIMSIILWLSFICIMLAIIMGKALNVLRASRTTYEESLLSQATKDKLTGVYNRHSIDEYLEYSVMQFYDSKVEHCLVMFDVDHFKQVNDAHGHQAGDDVLKNLAKIVQNRLRDTDILGRYGGEEFIVILTNTDDRGGNAFAESLRKLIEETPVATCIGEINITVSLGVGSFADIEDLTPHTLVKKVDEAMYASKHAGRNRSTYVRV